jgi:Holliday junction resolvase RusA-like endonuclease
MNFTAIVPGDPRGKGSVRVYNGHAMKDAKTAEYMTRAILAFQAASAGWTRLDGPWWADLLVLVDRPKALIPKAKARTPQPPSVAFVAPCKPDCDNVAKAVLDALVQAGVVVDDKACVSLRVRKFYVALGDSPEVRVTLGGVGEWSLTAEDR